VIVTVLWEDQLGGPISSFGPHQLLLACLEDQTKFTRTELNRQVISNPLKGNGNVRRALRQDLGKYPGCVFAVFDRDQVQRLWAARPPNCLRALRDALAADAPGQYDVVFLIDNIESVVDACCRALSRPVPPKKPSLNVRDRILNAAAWGAESVRRSILDDVPSFERLVRKVGDIVAASYILQG
jgi:hypothetical protein